MSEALATSPSIGGRAGDLETISEMFWGDGQPGHMLLLGESSGHWCHWNHQDRRDCAINSDTAFVTKGVLTNKAPRN